MDDPTASSDRDQQIQWKDRRWTRTARRQFDPVGGGDLASAIVRALADANRVPPTEETDPRLYDRVDVDAIAQFVSNGQSSDGTDSDFVRFDYDASLVEVRADGQISVFAPVEDTV